MAVRQFSDAAWMVKQSSFDLDARQSGAKESGKRSQSIRIPPFKIAAKRVARDSADLIFQGRDRGRRRNSF